MSKSKRDFTLSHTNYYFLQRTQPLEQHKPPAVNYILRDPQYFLHYFEDDERSAPHLPSVPSAFRERIGPRWASCRGSTSPPDLLRRACAALFCASVQGNGTNGFRQRHHLAARNIGDALSVNDGQTFAAVAAVQRDREFRFVLMIQVQCQANLLLAGGFSEVNSSAVNASSASCKSPISISASPQSHVRSLPSF